jgi:hypothetical protein
LEEAIQLRIVSKEGILPPLDMESEVDLKIARLFSVLLLSASPFSGLLSSWQDGG